MLYPVTPDIERFLRSMDRDALQSLALEMAGYSPEAMRSLQLRATPEDERPPPNFWRPSTVR